MEVLVRMGCLARYHQKMLIEAITRISRPYTVYALFFSPKLSYMTTTTVASSLGQTDFLHSSMQAILSLIPKSNF
jgi:hypothetical protein